MARQKLTQKIVDGLQYRGDRDIVWDTEARGLGVALGVRGHTYLVQYTVAKKERRVTLGRTDDIKLTEARDRCLRVTADSRQGKDTFAKPIGETLTFKDVCERWIGHSRPDGRPRSPRTINDYRYRCERLLYPAIGEKVLAKVSKVDVQTFLATMKPYHHRERAYHLTIIKAVYNFAIADKLLPKTHDNPADNIRLPKIVKDKRVLSAGEIERFGNTLRGMVEKREVTPWLAGLLRLSLLCGLRPGEAQSLKWEDVDFDRFEAFVVGKTGRRQIYLSEAAADVIRAVPRVEGNPYVFAGRVYGQHITGVAKQLDRIAERAKVERFTPYAFRHTAATQALASGADVRAVQALLGHSDLKTTTGYLHTTDERNRGAAQKVADFGKAMAPRTPG